MAIDPELRNVLDRIEAAQVVAGNRASLHEMQDERRFSALELANSDAKATRDKTLHLVEKINSELSGDGNQIGLWETVRKNTLSIEKIQKSQSDESEARKKAGLRLWAGVGATALVVLAAALNYLFGK